MCKKVGFGDKVGLGLTSVEQKMLFLETFGESESDSFKLVVF